MADKDGKYIHPILGVEGHNHLNGGGFVAETAHVDCSANVTPDARVSGDAQVYGNAWVSGNAWVYGNAQVSGDARVSGKTKCPSGWNGVIFCCNYFTATVNDGFVQIGCQSMPVSDWAKVTKSQAVKMGLPASRYPQYKAFIEMLIKEGGK